MSLKQILKEHKDFVGHTSTSIRNIFHTCRKQAKQRKNAGDVNLQEVAEYAADAYQPGKERREPVSTTVQREKVIAYFKRKAEDLGIEVAV